MALVPLTRQLRQQNVDLTATQASALATISRRQPLAVGDLAKAEHVSSPMITKVVRGLESAGLVRKDVDPVDRRVSLLSVNAGRHPPAGAQPDPQERLARQASPLPRTVGDRGVGGGDPGPGTDHNRTPGMTKLKVATSGDVPLASGPQLPHLLRRPGHQPGGHLVAVHRTGTARSPTHGLRRRARPRDRLPVPSGARVRRMGGRHLGPRRQAPAHADHPDRDDGVCPRARRVGAQRSHHRRRCVRPRRADRYGERIRQPVEARHDHRTRR